MAELKAIKEEAHDADLASFGISPKQVERARGDASRGTGNSKVVRLRS